MLKSFKSFLLSGFFIKNFFKSFIALLFFVLLIFLFLKIFTKHNKTIKVPNLIGLSLLELDSVSDKHVKLRYEIIDSVYDYSKVSGSIYSQTPQPYSEVKKNRKVYITIVSKVQKQIQIPDLKDLTYRAAKDKIESLNLVVGELIYVPDIAHNTVLNLKFNGEYCDDGMFVPERSKIDIVLGSGDKGKKVVVPDLIGLQYGLATKILKDNLLNFHSHYNEKLNIDSLYVLDQNPLFDGENTLKQGRYVDIYLGSLPSDSIIIE